MANTYVCTLVFPPCFKNSFILKKNLKFHMAYVALTCMNVDIRYTYIDAYAYKDESSKMIDPCENEKKNDFLRNTISISFFKYHHVNHTLSKVQKNEN